MTNQKHERFWFDKRDSYFSIMVEELRRAHLKGYSVIELARILDHKTCRNLYALMRDEGIYPLLERKRQRTFDLPGKFQRLLNSCQLSFLQWCNSHGLDPEKTAMALALDMDNTNPVSAAAHRAVRQDFRRAYEKIFGYSTEISASSRPKSILLQTRYSMCVVHVPERCTYAAYIPELPECYVESPNRNIAIRRLKSRYVAYTSVNKLRLLPDRFHDDGHIYK